MTKWLRGTPDIARPLRTDATRVGAVASTTRKKPDRLQKKSGTHKSELIRLTSGQK